jgi:2,5-dichloro-2,5-cyclohexadiene-1,4-diol dehydrogenase 1
VERFGRLDGAFNNAGIPMHFKLLPDLTSQEYDKVTGVHERGVFLCLKYEIAAMRQSGGGAIVNTSSTGGQTALPFMAEYVAAKHGILGLTRAAASEARNTDVRVNAVLPGLIATPALASAGEDYANSPEMKIIVERHSIGRIGQPEDVARAVKWLLSDESAFVNGVALPVDGGYLAR